MQTPLCPISPLQAASLPSVFTLFLIGSLPLLLFDSNSLTFSQPLKTGSSSIKMLLNLSTDKISLSCFNSSTSVFAPLTSTSFVQVASHCGYPVHFTRYCSFFPFPLSATIFSTSHSPVPLSSNTTASGLACLTFLLGN